MYPQAGITYKMVCRILFLAKNLYVDAFFELVLLGFALITSEGFICIKCRLLVAI